ncbi:MAG: dockerin type I domain-containing protein [Pirellulaceae bacterium]|nr:dockerin type I domain-containing protein [Pirellulaceae bacterium]
MALNITRDFLVATQRAKIANFEAIASGVTQSLGQVMYTRSYLDSPRITIASTTAESTSSQTGIFHFGFDLRTTHQRVVLAPGQNPMIAVAFNLQRGFAEDEIEGSLFGTPTSFTTSQIALPVSAKSVFDAAESQGVALLSLAPGQQSDVATLSLTDDVKARISNALNAGKLVIIPAHSVTIDGDSVIAWYESDLATGETVGVLSDGTHGINEQIATYIVANGQAQNWALRGFAGFLLGFLGDQIEVTLIKIHINNTLVPHGTYEDLTAGIKNAVMALRAAKAQLASKQFGFLLKDPAFFAGFAAGMIAGYYLAFDPPLSPALFDPTPFERPTVASKTRSIQSNASSGAVAATIQTAGLSVSGQLHVTFDGNVSTAISTSNLVVPTATIHDANGQLVGTGLITLAPTDPVAVSVSGAVHYDVVGTGHFSSFPESTSNLGAGVNFDQYQATLLGTATLQLTTDKLILSGVTLPAGTYTISTFSASLQGSGPGFSPNFNGRVSLQVTDGTIAFAPSSGNLSVGSTPYTLSNGLTLGRFSGSVALVADSTFDTATLNGSAGQVLRIDNVPTALSTDQNTLTNFQFDVQTSLTENYDFSVQAPIGWEATIGANGLVTLTPRAGVQSGNYSVQILARAQSNPSLVTQSQFRVAINPTQPAISLAVAPDDVLTIPFSGGLIPSAFRANIRNLGPAPDTFQLSFSGIPNGFELRSSGNEVTIPAGQTGISGFFLVPSSGQPLAAPGTQVSLSLTVTSTSDSAITQSQVVTFTMPTIDAITISNNPATVATTPGGTVASSIIITNAGNISESINFAFSTPTGLSARTLNSVTLSPGQSTTQNIMLTVDQSTPLNTTLNATITAAFGTNGAQQTQSLQIPVRVAVPGADAIATASVAASQLGNVDLANRLNDLSIALTNLVKIPDEPVFKAQALASLDSTLSLLAVNPILASFADPLATARDGLNAATTPTAIQSAVQSLGAALDNFAVVAQTLLRGNFELFLNPNSQVAQPQVPARFELLVHNIGTSATTYNVSVAGVPAGVTTDVSVSQVTLNRDGFATVVVTLTPTSLAELPAFDFQIDVSIAGTSGISKTANGSLIARREFVSVVSVTAAPPFTDAGGTVDVSARILNAVNREQHAKASFVVKDSTGQQVGAASTPVDVNLTVQTSLVTLSLGSINTTGLPNGNYSILLTLTGMDGRPIPGGTGTASFLVGSPLTASIDATPSVLPPGTSTVTNTLKIEALAPLVSSPTLVGQAAVAGANDVVRNGDFVYVANPAGISVFNIAGANLQNPQLLRTVGLATSLLEMRGNLLVSVLARPGGGSTTLTTFSLTDPANPTQLGTTGDIPYGTATDLIVTDTHAFIVLVNIIFTLNRDIIDQNGGLIAINISNPAAPFFDGDAVSANGTPAGRDGVNDGVLFNDNGTNNDGIKNPLGIDQSGGNQNTWSVVQVSPTILLLSGSTATGTDTQNGVGVVRVVDISDPRNMRLLRDLQIPGTVHVFDLAVNGNRALLTASQGGFADLTQNFPFTGNVVLATLNISDPANPQIIHQQTLDRAARGVDHVTALDNGLYAISNLGAPTDQPGLFIVDATDPNNLGIGGIDAPAGINELIGHKGMIFTTDGASLMVYDVPSNNPLTLVGQVPISGGSRGVAARNNIAYASGTNGIQIIDYVDPANPVVVGTIPGNHLGARIQENVLLALRPEGRSFYLDVFALQNTPLAPPLIGSSMLIRYDLANDLTSNTTHAFVSTQNYCVFLGSQDIYRQLGDQIAIKLNLDSIDNPTIATPTLDSVLFNTHGDNSPDPSDVSGCAEAGGDHVVFGVALVTPNTTYLATTTATQGNTQAGVGRIEVVDVTDEANPVILKSLDIPGTVVTLGVSVSGNVGVVVGSTQGFQDNPNGVVIGNLTVTTLDVTDRLDPKIVTTRILDLLSSTFWVNFTSLGGGRFAFASQGIVGNSVFPSVLVIDASNPRSPLIGNSSIPIDLIAPNSLSTDGKYLFTADTGGVSIYTINPLPGLPVTARVQIPNQTGVAVVPGSFNIPPSQIVAGTDFDTYVFDLTLAPSFPIETLTWQSTVTALRPGESRAVTLGTTIDFAFQGTAGQVTLPRTVVAAEQVMSLFPSERTVRPAEIAPFSIAFSNPSMVPVTYDLSVSGVAANWVEFDSNTLTVPAGGSNVAFMRLTSGAFDVLGNYDFLVNAIVGGVTTSVTGSLILAGVPTLPDARPESKGVVVSLTPTSATAGQGTSVTYVARVLNVGSQSDDFVIFTTGLPAGFQAISSGGIFTVPPGASNFRDILLTIIPPTGTAAADYPFSVTAASITDVTITGVTDGLLTVVAAGVAVDITPNSGVPGSSFQFIVTNTGQFTDTFDLMLAAPAALAATLGTIIVTLAPGQSQTVPINVGAIDFAFPGPLQLVGVAKSRANSSVVASDRVNVNIVGTLAMTAAFDQVSKKLAQPGTASFLLRVDNLGNLEDQYTATILSKSGPVTASLVGLDGRAAQSIPLFRLPGLASGAILLSTALGDFGQGEVTVQIRSLTDNTIVSEATASVQTDLLPTTLSIAATSADKLEGNSSTTPFTFTVTRLGDVSGATTVLYTVTGVGTTPANTADFGGAFPSGQVSFGANESSKVIAVNVSGDATNEPDEKFSVTLSNASGGAMITTSAASGTIRNDDVVAGFKLTCSSLHVGLNTCTILGATPFGIVNLAIGIQPGDRFLPKFHVTLGMLDPTIVAQGIVQPDGRAVVQFTIATAQLLEQVLLNAFEQVPTPRTTNIVIVGAPQMSTEGNVAGTAKVSASALPALLTEAISRWTATGLSNLETQLLKSVTVEIADLPAGMLGRAVDQRIYIDDTAAGHGWFVDGTPAGDTEFSFSVSSTERTAVAASPAFGRADLLTVLMHELGHVLGHSDVSVSSSSPLMLAELPLATRRLLTSSSITTTTTYDTRDVNRDGFLSPIDVLLVINHLNRRAAQAPTLDLLSTNHCDVNNDGVVSPIDVLLVINSLNRQHAALGAEGESSIPHANQVLDDGLASSSTADTQLDEDLISILASDAIRKLREGRANSLTIR